MRATGEVDRPGLAEDLAGRVEQDHQRIGPAQLGQGGRDRLGPEDHPGSPAVRRCRRRTRCRPRPHCAQVVDPDRGQAAAPGSGPGCCPRAGRRSSPGTGSRRRSRGSSRSVLGAEVGASLAGRSAASPRPAADRPPLRPTAAAAACGRGARPGGVALARPGGAVGPGRLDRRQVERRRRRPRSRRRAGSSATTKSRTAGTSNSPRGPADDVDVVLGDPVDVDHHAELLAVAAADRQPDHLVPQPGRAAAAPSSSGHQRLEVRAAERLGGLSIGGLGQADSPAGPVRRSGTPSITWSGVVAALAEEGRRRG